ncbi:RNA polymerase sigma factor [Methylomonas sp. LL1]|uniref:RNA polymerase sigma factor n=1 Tax=Methylomonas sp. LL1 TaxID=2785785 RepID=UPI001E537518|nr:RNA polymerase sigma factor [Methylomonas sp. LL1]
MRNPQEDITVDEQVLLQRIIMGDMLAFEAFYKVYYPRLFRFILRMTRSPDSVEELIQETLMVVWEKPDRFNHDSKISTWVFGIAYHKALKAMSNSNRRGNDVDVDELAETLGDPSANQAQSQENQDWLNRALAALPPDQRAVIELTFYYDLPYQDIAKILDCPENTVKTRMFHARKKLQVFAATQEC